MGPGVLMAHGKGRRNMSTVSAPGLAHVRHARWAAVLGLAFVGVTVTAPASAQGYLPGSFQLDNYVYGTTASNSYIHWQIDIFGGGMTPYVYTYSNTVIGYQAAPAPTAGAAFYLHLATANVSVNEPGMFSLALDPQGSGLRAVTDGSLPAICRKGAIAAPTDFPCRGPVAGPTGTTWADPVQLAPGEQLDIQVPVVIDSAGTHPVSVSCDESQFLQSSYKADVAVPVATGTPNVPGPQVSQPGTPGPTGPTAVPTLLVQAVSRSGKLRVDVDPDLGKRSWKFRVDRQQADGSWKPGKTYRTKGARETRTINLRRGAYRVQLPAANGYQETTSGPVTLLR